MRKYVCSYLSTKEVSFSLDYLGFPILFFPLKDPRFERIIDVLPVKLEHGGKRTAL